RTHSERMPRGQAGRCQTPLRTVVLEETVWTGCLTPIWATWGFAAKTCLVGRSLTPTWPHGTPAAWGFAPRRAALQLRILRARACRRGLVGQLERGEPPQGAEGRSEERRVGKEGRARRAEECTKKKATSVQGYTTTAEN